MALNIDFAGVVAAVSAVERRAAAGNAYAAYLLPKTVRQARYVIWLAGKGGVTAPAEAQALFEGVWATRVPLGPVPLPDSDFRQCPIQIFNAWSALKGRPGKTIEH